jgi:hypothetical protein
MFYIYNYECFGLEATDNVYAYSSDERCRLENPFDYVFDQGLADGSENFMTSHLGSHTNSNPIELDEKFYKFKAIASSIQFNKELADLVKFYSKLIKDPCIGVHVRITDMYEIHPDYGNYSSNDYIAALKKYPNSYNIFVASDNDESIKKLVDVFGDRVFYVPNLKRMGLENDSSYELQVENISSKSFWHEAFLEMILLSMCDTLICRTSNLTNAAIIFSRKDQKVDRI